MLITSAFSTKAGLVRVVRTRRVRAIEERYFGRTARMFYVGVGEHRAGEALPLDFNDFEVAAKESQEAYQAQPAVVIHPPCPDPAERAAAFWAEAMALVHEFDQLPRSGDTTFGFVVGVYPDPGLPGAPRPGAVTLKFTLDFCVEP